MVTSRYGECRKKMKKPILLPLLVLALALSINSTSAQDNTRYKGPIIDMHLHTGLPHEIPAGTPSLCRPEPCEGDSPAIVDPTELMNKTLEAMKNHRIVKAHLSGTDWEAVDRWASENPELFIPSPFLLKAEKSEFVKLKKAYSELTFLGMGEIGTQLNGIQPNHPLLSPYFQLAEELNLPTLIHAEGIGPYLPNFRSSVGRPLLLEDVLVEYPKLRLYVENAGYPYQDEMIAMMYQYPQLYADVSTITWVIPRSAFYEYLEAFIKAGLGKRLMFGTDQMVWPQKIGEAVSVIQQAPFLTVEQKADIFYNNAARFLQLSEEEIDRHQNMDLK